MGRYVEGDCILKNSNQLTIGAGSLVVKICLQAQAAYMSIKEEWSRLRFSNVVSSILDLEWSLASAEKEMIQRWYSHILACGFRCERDDPVSRHHMKHILAMLEETLSNHLDPLAEEDISRDIPIVRSAVNLALKFTTSILDDQRQRITRAKLFDNQSNSPSSVARQKLQKKSQHENEYSGNTSSGGHQESFRGTLDSIVEPAEVYRDLYDEEMLVVEDLERHIAICLTCDLAIREIRLDYQGVCELGHKLAVDASQYIYSKDGHYFSSLFSGTRFGRARRLNLPRNFTTTRTLLKAVEKGLELHFHGRENTTNTSISGPSRHPSQSQHDERSRVAELDVSFERACSSISGDSGYDSRAPSANSYERPLHGAGHPLSQPKTILHTTRLPHSKGGRPQSSLRSYGTMNLEEIEQEEAWSDESHDHSGNPASHT